MLATFTALYLVLGATVIILLRRIAMKPASTVP
jgi:hypothetical protein